MRPPQPNFGRRLLVCLAATSLMVACGGGVESEEDDHDHEETTIDTAGRLAVTELNTTTLRIHDLDSGSVEASHTMLDVPSAVYASAGGRYAVVPQGLQDRVQFVGGGVWQEGHGDHHHDYKQASRALACASCPRAATACTAASAPAAARWPAAVAACCS